MALTWRAFSTRWPAALASAFRLHRARTPPLSLSFASPHGLPRGGGPSKMDASTATEVVAILFSLPSLLLFLLPPARSTTTCSVGRLSLGTTSPSNNVGEMLVHIMADDLLPRRMQRHRPRSGRDSQGKWRQRLR